MEIIGTAVREAAPGVFWWDAYDPSVKTNLSSCAIVVAGALVLVDPIPLVDSALHALLAKGRPACIVLTNGNHERAAEQFRSKLHVPLCASANALPHLGLTIDRVVRCGESLPGGVEIAGLTGAGPGEIALHIPGQSLHVGDGLINLVETGFTFLPEKYCEDPKQLRHSAEKLLRLEFSLLTFAHGAPLTDNPRQRLSLLLS